MSIGPRMMNLNPPFLSLIPVLLLLPRFQGPYVLMCRVELQPGGGGLNIAPLSPLITPPESFILSEEVTGEELKLTHLQRERERDGGVGVSSHLFLCTF